MAQLSSAATNPKPTVPQSLAAYVREWRYDGKGLVLCFLVMYLGWIALAGGLEPSANISVGSIVAATASATCILLAAFLVNDAADRDIDLVVHPERPIPRGLSSWQHIYVVGLFLLVVGIALGLLVNTRFAISLSLLAILVLLHYGYLKKHYPIPCSSELVSPAVSALFPLSAFMVAPDFDISVLLAVMAFIYFADLAHDLIGGVHDAEGDKRLNVRTFAIDIGDRVAMIISAISFILCLIAGSLLYILAGLGWIYLAAFTILSAIALFYYARLFIVSGTDLKPALHKANHFGGVYFFVVSASILPDHILARLLG